MSHQLGSSCSTIANRVSADLPPSDTGNQREGTTRGAATVATATRAAADRQAAISKYHF